MKHTELLDGYYLLTFTDKEVKEFESLDYSDLSFFLSEEEYLDIIFENCFISNQQIQITVIHIAATYMAKYQKMALINGYANLLPPPPPKGGTGFF
jgi:hypothetical protein